MNTAGPHLAPLSRQLNVSAFSVPQGWSARRTTTLLDSGLLSVGAGPGLVAYTALGTELLERLEADCVQGLAKIGYDLVRLPHIMSDGDISTGDEVGEQFGRKIVGLSEPFVGYHLITSPETLIARLTERFELSHRSMPLRLAYRTSIFRNMPETRSFLTCREFRVVGAITMLPETASTTDVLAELDRAAEAIAGVAASWGVPTTHVGKAGVNELSYPSADEGDLRVVVDGERHRALSLSVGYHYGKDIEFPASYRAADNRERHPRIMTFAACTNRLLYSAFDATRDDHGFALSPAARPYDVALLPRSEHDVAAASALAIRLQHTGARVALDDRVSRKVAARAAFASYLGTPIALVVHRDVGVFVPRGTAPDFNGAVPLTLCLDRLLHQLRGDARPADD